MSYILQIDTSGENGTLVLSSEGKILSHKIIDDNKKQATLINILIDELLSEASIDFTMLQVVAVIAGPGSYTGVRIGLATAKGICYSLSIPLIIQTKLEILSKQLIHAFSSEFYGSVLKARENEFFIAIYNNNYEIKISPQHVTEEELKSIFSKIESKTYISTDCFDELCGFDSNNICVYENANVDTKFWSLYCMQSFNDCNFNNLSTSEPYYLKQVFTHKPLKNN